MSGRGRIAAWLGAAGAAALAAGCAGKPAPAPAPAPIVHPAPPPAPLPPPEPSQQSASELPLTAGDWSYAGDSGGSAANFGPAEAVMFSLRCDAARRRVSLSVREASRPFRLRTSFGERSLPAGAGLPAADPLLDEIVFSRGRFTVEADGQPTLIMPTWPEPARVIEDCRG